MADHLPHVDGSGRGMDDGECIHCGVSGSLEGAECPVRLREALDEALRDLADQERASLWNAVDPRHIERADPIRSVEDDPCPACGSPVGWSCSSGVGSTGRIRCASCAWTGREIVRVPGGDVVVLPAGAETHIERLVRMLRVSRGYARA